MGERRSQRLLQEDGEATQLRARHRRGLPEVRSSPRRTSWAGSMPVRSPTRYADETDPGDQIGLNFSKA